MKRLLTLIPFILGFTLCSFAQETFPQMGVSDSREGLYAFTKATIYTDFQTKLENATLLIRDGKVVAVGTKVRIPKDAVEIDLEGKFIYPSFIDVYSDYGMPKVESRRDPSQRGPQVLSKKEGAYSWNESLKPEFEADAHFSSNEKAAKAYRSEGFGAVLSHQMDGIARGSSVLVSLGTDKEQALIIKAKGANHLSFNRGSTRQNYPRSLMGAIALLRQTYYDAQWYTETGKQQEVNLSLEAWNQRQNLLQVFEVRDWQEALRASRIAREFNTNYVLKGSGDEYQRLEAIAGLNTTFIIPLDFPEGYDLSDPYDANLVDLDNLKHWELAPYNPGRLANAGVPIVLTTHGLEKKSQFQKKLREAIEKGLDKKTALKALTLSPARLLGVEDMLGSLETGKIANLIVTSGDIFEEDSKIHHNWIQGKPHVLVPIDERDLSGQYKLMVADTSYSLEVIGSISKMNARIIVNDSTEKKVSINVDQELLFLKFQPEESEMPYRLSGTIHADGKWSGNGDLGNGQLVKWNAKRIGDVEQKEEKDENSEEKEGPKSRKAKEEPSQMDESPGEVIYPFTAYGSTELPKAETYLIKNATIWTNERDGILENTDLLIRNGKIAAIGRDINVDIGTVIDASGKHLTPGIIDEHSHIAISRGVNEGSQYSSAEVSIGDVINSEDINIYRQLSGGVTAAQLLHGSANPIGGQSGIIKMRWGYLPEDMKIKDADPFIKFALGENVKQSNWGDDNRTRYPQTRMGVEQVFEDHFTRAKEYGEKKASGKPYRVDLEMEALLEIVKRERFITCHSYQQGEINMLMKVAERFGFRVNTFTHILEGYKVADKMAAHGAGGSSFSDWWAYKYEVIDAIPYNGVLLHSQGVTTAFNSDDAEMARRLNQEAAKAVMYGDLSEEEALKFVTLNPAKLLHIDHRTGSIKEGKDADLVIWSDHPLSVYAKAEKTFVDGIKFFDRQEDLEKREWIRKERARLVKKSISAKEKGGKMRPPRGKRQHLYHCDDLMDEIGNSYEEEHTHEGHGH
jgi:imidazolonepropionase-like amidohydrolase